MPGRMRFQTATRNSFAKTTAKPTRMDMFKRCLFAGLLFTAFSAPAQDAVKVINFLDLPHASLKETFDYKRKIKVEISNVNRFLYKLSDEKTETDFNVQPPAILTGLKLPGFLNTGAPAPAGGAPFTKEIKRDTLKIMTPVKLQEALQANLDALINTQKYVDSAVNLHNKIAHISKDCDATFQVIEGKVHGELKNFTKLQASIPVLIDTVETTLDSMLRAAPELYRVIEQLKKDLLEKNLAQFRANQHVQKENIVTAKADVTTLQEKLKKEKNTNHRASLSSQIKEQEKEVRDEEGNLETMIEDHTASDKDIDGLVEKAKALADEIRKFREEGKAFTIVEDIKKVNEANYSYYTELVKMTKDEVKFAINAASESPLPCNKPNEQKFTVTLRTKGGVKLDFSTGVFLNFGNNEFLGQQFYYKPLTDSLSTIAMVDAGKRVGVGIGALMNIYWRSPSHIKGGGAIGVSTTTGFDALNLHLGLSLILGDKERFCITPGLVLREVDGLDNRYVIGNTYATALLPEAVPVTKKFPKSGFFVSFTYNVSRFGK